MVAGKMAAGAGGIVLAGVIAFFIIRKNQTLDEEDATISDLFTTQQEGRYGIQEGHVRTNGAKSGKIEWRTKDMSQYHDMQLEDKVHLKLPAFLSLIGLTEWQSDLLNFQKRLD